MDFYTNFVSRGDTLYVRHYRDGIQCESEFPIRPKLYVNTPIKNSGLETIHRNIANEPVYELEFESPKEAKGFIKSYENSSMRIFGYPRFDYAEVDNNFPGDIEFDYDLIRIVAVDIETEVEYGFPNVKEGNEIINLISLSFRGKFYTFGLKPWGLSDPDVTYVHCKSEEILLKSFYTMMQKIKPDIITGWNVVGFDIPYLYNRTMVVLNESWSKKLSPYGWCRSSITNFMGREQVNIDVDGVQVLDYLELYKKFELSPRENYKLGTIAQIELGDNKIELDCSFKESYSDANWDRHVEYNVHDVRLIDRLDAKLQFIRVAVTMALSAKCQFADVYRVTRVWDNTIANHLRAQNVHVDAAFRHSGDGYEGAFVKPTIPGLYEWCASFDVASLYPSMIVQYNISPDTILDSSEFLKITPYDVLSNSDAYKEALRYAKSRNATLCANGSMYSKEKQGFLPFLVEKYFARRVAEKKEMKKWGKEAERAKVELKTTTGNKETLKAYIDECESKAHIYDKKQHATKILLNSLYGCLGTQYFRLFDIFQAEGITLSGQVVVTKSYDVMNDFVNSALKSDSDYVVASDTDSCYVNFSPLMKVLCDGKSFEDQLKVMQKICDTVLPAKLTTQFDALSLATNAWNNAVDMKREAIASACFVAKKNYVMNVYDNEGTVYSTPKQKITGLEAIKSSTPKFFQDKLKIGYGMVFNSSEEKVHTFVADVYKEYMALPIEDVVATTSVTELEKYEDGDDGFAKGAQGHIKGAIMYNRLLKSMKLDDKYVEIRAGDKLKIINLKVPNPLGLRYFCYLDSFPTEMIDMKYIDRDSNYEKYFVGPLKRVIGVLEWTHEYSPSIEDFFD